MASATNLPNETKGKPLNRLIAATRRTFTIHPNNSRSKEPASGVDSTDSYTDEYPMDGTKNGLAPYGTDIIPLPRNMLPRVIMSSPFHKKNHLCRAYLHPNYDTIIKIFCKASLLEVDKHTTMLEINLERPKTNADQIYPADVLSPMVVQFRHLVELRIYEMHIPYQTHIWQVVWLNPNLKTLELGMANQEVAEAISWSEIYSARELAKTRPSMKHLVLGKQNATIPAKLPLEVLSLNYFIVSSAPFKWLDPTKIKNLNFYGCVDAGFRLPRGLMSEVTVSVADEEGNEHETISADPKRIVVGKLLNEPEQKTKKKKKDVKEEGVDDDEEEDECDGEEDDDEDDSDEGDSDEEDNDEEEDSDEDDSDEDEDDEEDSEEEEEEEVKGKRKGGKKKR